MDRISEIEPVAGNPAGQFKACLKLTQNTLTELEIYVNDHPFVNQKDQRHYTEKILPRFRALEFYYYELIWLMCNRPAGDRFEWVLYYQQELEAVRYFLNRHAIYYQRYKIKAMGLEDILVSSYYADRWIGQSGSGGALPETERVSLFAKLMAYDKLQEYLLQQLQLLREIELNHPQGLRSKQMHWTGDVCNLVELVYGLYETKQINNGDAALNDLIQCMEQLFHVNLNRANRVFFGIKQRKIKSYTSFIEQMRASIQNKIDQENAYVPKKPIRN